jgi:hypothetical protein
MRSDGARLAEGIVALDAEALAYYVATMQDTTLYALLRSKVTDLVKRTKDGHAARVAESGERLAKEPKNDLVFLLHRLLDEALGIEPHPYRTQLDVEAHGDRLLKRCCEELAQQDETFTGGTLADLARWAVSRQFNVDLTKVSEEKQENLIDQIMEVLGQADSAAREHLMAALGIEEVTREEVRRALLGGALPSLLAAAVSLGGFGFYVGATSLLHSAAALVGLTLPFAAYTGLTSLIAVLANPLFTLPAMALYLGHRYRKDNKKIRLQLATMLVANMATLTLIEQPDGQADCAALVAQWGAALAEHQTLVAKQSAAEASVGSAEKGLDEAEQTLGAHRKEHEAAKSRLANAGGRIRAFVRDQPPDDLVRWVPGIGVQAEVLMGARLERERLKTGPAEESVIAKAGRQAKALPAGLKVRAAEEAVSTAIMAEYAKTHACSHPALAIMMQDMAEEQSAVDAALTTVNGSEKLVDQARATLKAAEAALSKAKGDVVTQEALYRGFAVGA